MTRDRELETDVELVDLGVESNERGASGELPGRAVLALSYARLGGDGRLTMDEFKGALRAVRGRLAVPLRMPMEFREHPDELVNGHAVS